MESFIFSINAILPIFLIMLLGYFIKRVGIVDKNFFNLATKFCFKIVIPIMLFNNIINNNLLDVVQPKLVIVALASILVFCLLLQIGGLLFIKDPATRGTFIHVCYRGNFLFFGIPILESICGDQGVAIASMIIAFVVPLYNILGVLVLTLNRRHDGDCTDNLGKKMKTALYNIITNPIIIGIFAGFVFYLCKIPLPGVFAKSISSVAAIGTPLALMIVGASIDFKTNKNKLPISILATSIKTVIYPIAVMIIGYLVGIRGINMAVLMVVCGTPSATTTYIMAHQMNSDYELASQTILLTNSICAVTICIGIFFLRAKGFI